MKALLIVLSAVVFLAGSAQAATFDVTTAEQLQTALTTAQNNGQDDLIRVAESNDAYTRPGCFTHTPAATENYSLVIQGGWNTGFTYRYHDPYYTQLNGNYACRTLTLNASNGSTGDFTVDTLRIIMGSSGGVSGGGLSIIANPPARVTVSGCQIEYNTSSAHAGGLFVASHNNALHTGGPIVIANNLIRDNSTNGSGGGVYIYSADTLQFYNNLVYLNGALAAGGGLVLANLQGTAHVANNTITDNNAYVAGGGIYLSDGGGGWANNHAFLFNNIVYGNTVNAISGNSPSDIYNADSATVPAAGNTVTIVNNDFADLESGPASVAPVADENIDEPPLFATTEFDSLTKELTAGSPCIDRGTNWAPFVPEIDYQGEMRIMDGDKNGSAVVDMGAYEYPVDFTKLTLIVPNGGEVLAAEQTYTLRWADPGDGEKYRLFYSINGGSTWLPIDPGFVEGSSYTWTVPAQAVNKPNCRVQVRGFTAAGDPTGTDASNRSFTIEVIHLLSPDGGESIDTGSVATISWAAASNYEKYRLYYSLDNGVTWKAVAGADPFDMGPLAAAAIPPFVTGTSFDWDVPLLNTNAKRVKVKVVGYDAGERKLGSDASDGPFELEVLKVLAPNGGEVLTSGLPLDITWDANETVRSAAGFRLQYTINNGISWKAIGTTVPGDGTYPWTVPTVASTKRQCRIRLQLLDGRGAVITSDTSDKVFTIQLAP